jgi:branched-chain amino acid transport system permease protein
MAMRAVSFNPQAAALMGVNINRIISFTFGLGSALAAIAGIFYAMRAPALTRSWACNPACAPSSRRCSAASAICPAPRWAACSGLLETFAGGIPGLSNYRDGIAFAILILILIFRPAGLLGEVQTEKV